MFFTIQICLKICSRSTMDANAVDVPRLVHAWRRLVRSQLSRELRMQDIWNIS